MGLFNLNDLYESEDGSEILLAESAESLQVFTEAVFQDGEKQLEPLIPKVQAIKDALENELKEKKSEFAPKAFWRNPLWKDLENEICKIFGFKNVTIAPYIERYNHKEDVFQSREINAFVYNNQRYLINGLLTDKGFYDETKSMELDVRVSLGLLRLLDTKEFIAVVLHEFGHAIDPALVDIKYHATNVLTKYMTDREKEIKPKEKITMRDVLGELMETGIIIIFLPIILAASLVEIGKAIYQGFQMLFNKKNYTKKMSDKYLEKITKAIRSDHTKFNKKYYAEAYADNFARMYGYGPELISALKKLSKDFDKRVCDRSGNEILRQKIIASITKDVINDCHKTDIHRARALILEYKKDIDDPNTPPIVKKQLQEDLKELEIIVDSYTKDFSDFQNKVNKKINEELQKLEEEAEDGSDKKDEKEAAEKKEESKNNKDEEKDKNINEYVITESNKAYEKLMNDIKSTTKEERGKARRIFGNVGCSLAKDKDGYYFATHRARTKSYENIEDIPKSKVRFVDSTC